MVKPWLACHGLLREGYGTEDIALILRCSLERVRREVARLRAEGKLIEIYGKENEA